MRILGALLFLLGGAASAAAVARSFGPRGAVSYIWGIGAPVAVLVALVGALLLFVPGFFN